MLLEERVTRLEVVLEEFIKAVKIEFERLYDAQLRTEAELRVFKDEMRAFREQSEADRRSLHAEMKAFKDEMRVFKDEMRAFREQSEVDRRSLHAEMRAFKDEMRVFKDEIIEENRKMNKNWGNLTNKLGTIVEDLIYPALGPVIRQYFDCEPVYMMSRVRRKQGDDEEEIDAIAECEGRVFLVEVRSTPRNEHIHELKAIKLERFKRFFPEYEGKDIIPILASVRFKDNVLRHATREKVYVMAYKEWEYMSILNFDAING